jgi:hypothetical protein
MRTDEIRYWCIRWNISRVIYEKFQNEVLSQGQKMAMELTHGKATNSLHEQML